MRRPQLPDVSELSEAVIVQFVGSVLLEAQALAVSVVPTTRNRTLYDVPAVAANGAMAMVVEAPPTFFWTTRLAPSRYALYQLLVSVKRTTAPMLAPLKELTEPVNSTSALPAVGPSTALCGPEPLATCPALLLIEK